MLTPRTSRRLTLQQQRDMLTGDVPENLLFGEPQTANTSTVVPGTGFESLFNRGSQTYSNEEPSILQNIGIPSVEAPPVSGLPREPQSIQDIDTMYRNGEITKEQADQYELLFSNQKGSDIPNSNIDDKGRLLTDGSSSYSDPSNPFTFPLFNSAGSDLSTELYSLGMGIGAEPGTKGRGATIAGSAGAAALDIAGTVLSGVGFSKRNRFLEEEERRKQQDVDYTPNSQTANSNITGGLSYGEYGGLFYPSKNVPKYPDGGTSGGPNPYYKEQLAVYNSWNKPENFIKETDKVLEGPELDAWYAEQIRNNPSLLESNGSFVGGFKPVKVHISESGDAYYPVYAKPGRYSAPTSAPVSSTPTGGSTSTPAVYRSANTGQPLPERGSPGQVDYQYAQFLDEFASSPEMVAARNNQQSEIERNKSLLQTMTEEQKADMRSKKMTPSQYLSPGSGTPSFKDGGLFGKKVGDPIKFNYGGEMISGKIKKIENGQIYLE
jgi:hypothetical protein